MHICLNLIVVWSCLWGIIFFEIDMMAQFKMKVAIQMGLGYIRI